MKNLLALFLLLCATIAHAVPATINITPTTLSDDGTGGPVDRYVIHQDCDLASQTIGQTLANPAVVGQSFAIVGDTDDTYTICAVGVNAAGVSGFANTVTLTFEDVTITPGNVRIVLDCDLDLEAGTVANCVQTNNP